MQQKYRENLSHSKLYSVHCRIIKDIKYRVPDTRFLSPNSIIQGQGCLLYLDRKAIKAAWVKNRERGKFEVFAYPKD